MILRSPCQNLHYERQSGHIPDVPPMTTVARYFCVVLTRARRGDNSARGRPDRAARKTVRPACVMIYAPLADASISLVLQFAKP